MLKYLIFICLAVFTKQQSGNTCTSFIRRLLIMYQIRGPIGLIDGLPTETVMYSGKGINDLGQYDSCLDAGFNYITFQVQIAGLPFKQYLGLCMPTNCQASDLSPYEGNLTDVIKQQLNIPQETNVKTQIYDPRYQYPKFDFLAGMTAVLVSIIGILVVAGTAMTLYQGRTQSRSSKPINTESNSSDSTTQTRVEEFLPVPQQILKCFSLDENFRRLIHVKATKPQEDNFKIFNAMRVFSISWVIYGHVCLIEAFGMKNTTTFMETAKQVGWMTLAPAAYYAVDIFFFMGGFLSCVLMEEKFRTSRNLKASVIPLSYLHRFIRLWPTYMTCLFFYWKITVYFGDGPIWNSYIQAADYCNDSWWENFLLIDNMFVHQLDYCFGWGWYISNDFQIFLLGTPIMYFFIKKRWMSYLISWSGLSISLLLSYIICEVYSYHFNYPNLYAEPMNNYLSYYYYKPYIRCAPYFMGIIFGYAYINYKQEPNERIGKMASAIKESTFLRIFLQLLGFACVSFVVWVPWPLQEDMDAWNQQEQSLFQTFGRVLFVGGVAMLITPALLKVPNDPVSKILSADLFVPLARVSFCVYLVHFILILYYYNVSRQLQYATPGTLSYSSVPIIVLSFIFGALFSLMVESPLTNLEKVKWRPPKPKRSGEELSVLSG